MLFDYLFLLSKEFIFFNSQENGLEDTSYFEKKYLKVNPGDSSCDEEDSNQEVDHFLGFSYVRNSDDCWDFAAKGGDEPVDHEALA